MLTEANLKIVLNTSSHQIPSSNKPDSLLSEILCCYNKNIVRFALIVGSSFSGDKKRDETLETDCEAEKILKVPELWHWYGGIHRRERQWRRREQPCLQGKCWDRALGASTRNKPGLYQIFKNFCCWVVFIWHHPYKVLKKRNSQSLMIRWPRLHDPSWSFQAWPAPAFWQVTSSWLAGSRSRVLDVAQQVNRQRLEQFQHS